MEKIKRFCCRKKKIREIKYFCLFWKAYERHYFSYTTFATRNTTHLAKPYLKRFLNSKNISAFQMNLNSKVILERYKTRITSSI